MLIACFAVWERRASEPLVDLTLFREAAFTVGTLLSTAVSFVMFGVLFAVPQYYQAILGADAMGGAIRLLPMIGGMLAGAVASTADWRSRGGPGRRRWPATYARRSCTGWTSCSSFPRAKGRPGHHR